MCLPGEEIDHVSSYAPFFEIDPHWEGDEFHWKFAEAAEKIGRRMFNTHLLWEMMPKGDNAR